MNSSLFFYAVKTFYGGGAFGESGVRMKHTFFNQFPSPMPGIDSDNPEEFKAWLYKTIGLTDIEISLIEG